MDGKVVEFKSKQVTGANVTVIDIPSCCLTCKYSFDKGGSRGVYCSKLQQTMKPFNICNYYTLK